MNVPVTLTSLSAIYNNQRHALKSKTFGKKKVSDTRLVPTFWCPKWSILNFFSPELFQYLKVLT